ncbi:efflux RND transporter permease subunit, partial [Escherichia coli]|nr:efflux RND transporter permease subunit [Escherichia coli]
VVAEGQKRTPIVIRGDESLRKDAARFADLQLRTPDGTLARVSDMARVARTQGPVKLDHENGSRFALVQAFVSGRDLVGYVDEAKAAVATKVRLPAGYSIVW